MENMIKQMRVRFSGIEEGTEGETSRAARDRNLPSQKTGSFKGDNRRSRNWYRRQSSRELSYDYDSDYMESDEFQTAVAAAAFAINSVEERRRKTKQRREDSMTKSKRKPEDVGAVSVTRKARERMFSSSPSNKMKNKEDATVSISTPTLLSKKSSELRERVPSKATSPANTELENEAPRETVGSSPFVKKTSSISFDRQSDKGQPESGMASPSRPPTTPPAFPATEVDRKRSEPRIEDIKADVWEKTEMERIKERYEKLNAKILEWEYEKKEKAKKKLSRHKDESEKKRARALQKYKTDIEMIEQIVEGARSQAEENQRKEIIRVKEKADNIRLTGKIPTKTCLCF